MALALDRGRGEEDRPSLRKARRTTQARARRRFASVLLASWVSDPLKPNPASPSRVGLPSSCVCLCCMTLPSPAGSVQPACREPPSSTLDRAVGTVTASSCFEALSSEAVPLSATNLERIRFYWRIVVYWHSQTAGCQAPSAGVPCTHGPRPHPWRTTRPVRWKPDRGLDPPSGPRGRAEPDLAGRQYVTRSQQCRQRSHSDAKCFGSFRSTSGIRKDSLSCHKPMVTIW